MVRFMGRLRAREARASAGTVEWLKGWSGPLRSAADLDPLLDRVGEARFVLLGEASHGTSEFYTWRAELSRRLITEKGFSFLAVEGDWPPCERLDHHIKGREGAGDDPREVLRAFDRWPTWMWANEEVADLADWLRDFNRGRPEGRKVGFHGLDVYSLFDSLFAVLGYLHRTNPQALDAARRAFRCFEPYGEDLQEYARAAALVPTSCEDEVVALLRRARERHEADGVVLVGLSTRRGGVIAGRSWDAPMRVMDVPEARPDSWDDLLSRATGGDALFLVDLSAGPAPPRDALEPRGQRAIGVVYHPEY
jgi:erythromycin esterase-like protein